MTEHEIRLRRAWTVIVPGMEENRSFRVDLPAPWPPGPARQFRLQRRFQRPRLDRTSDRLLLRISDAPGWVRIRLDGRELEAGEPDPGTLKDWDLTMHSPRAGGSAVLEIDVDFRAGDEDRANRPSSWGAIRLVIQSEGGVGVGRSNDL